MLSTEAPSRQTLGSAIAAALKLRNLSTVMSIPGDFNLCLLNALLDGDLNLIGCCNELNEGYAADGFARINGLSVAVVTYNVGEYSILNALAGACSENSPFVLIGGMPPTERGETLLQRHHTTGATNLKAFYNATKPLTCYSCILDDMSSAVTRVHEALDLCARTRKPAYIGIPCNYVNQLVPCSVPRVQLLPALDVDLTAKLAARLGERIAAAQRPLFLCGEMLAAFGLADAMDALLRKSGVPFFTVPHSKAVLSETHPNFLGLYVGTGRTRAQLIAYLQQTDCLIWLGEQLTDFNTPDIDSLVNFDKVVRLDAESAVVDGQQVPNVCFKTLITQLSQVVQRHRIASSLAQFAANYSYGGLDSVAAQMTSEQLDMNSLFGALTALLPQDAALCVDTGSAMFEIQNAVFPRRLHFIGQTRYGSIGYALPAGLGIAAAQRLRGSGRTVVLIGDGAFQMTCQELSTIIRQKLNPIVVVLNNDGYVIERAICDNSYNDIQPWKYSDLPAVFCGTKSVIANTREEFFRALQDALRNESSYAFIEAKLDRKYIGVALHEAGTRMWDSAQTVL